MKKKATSQASWSILSEGVSSARVEAHIVRTHLNQLVEAIKAHPQLAEEIYKRCGDNFEAMPKHLSKLERSLDRTNYALISMGSDWYRQRLTHEDREMVDLASKYNPTPFPSAQKQSENTMNRSAGSMKDLLLDILDEYLDELIKHDPDFDEDLRSPSWIAETKQDALYSGDFEAALDLTQDRRAKEVLLTMQDEYLHRTGRRKSASDLLSNLERRVAKLERR